METLTNLLSTVYLSQQKSNSQAMRALINLLSPISDHRKRRDNVDIDKFIPPHDLQRRDTERQYPGEMQTPQHNYIDKFIAHNLLQQKWSCFF